MGKRGLTVLTENEAKTLEAVISEKTYRAAAERLGVKQNTISQRMSRMRLKEVLYDDWLTEYRRYKHRMPLRYVETSGRW